MLFRLIALLGVTLLSVVSSAAADCRSMLDHHDQVCQEMVYQEDVPTTAEIKEWEGCVRGGMADNGFVEEDDYRFIGEAGEEGFDAICIQ